MHLDIENLLKRRRLVIEPAADAVVSARSILFVAWSPQGHRRHRSRGLDHPQLGQLPLTGPLEEHELRRDSRKR